MISGQTAMPRVTDRQEKAQLRAKMQDAVHEFTTLRRQKIWEEVTAREPNWTQAQVQAEVDERQPEFAEFDPVVEMAVVAADYRNPVDVRLRALGESAQYVRPKLKSIEMVVDPLAPEEQAQRTALAERLVALLDAGAAAKRATVVEAQARDVTPPGQPATVGDDEPGTVGEVPGS